MNYRIIFSDGIEDDFIKAGFDDTALVSVLEKLRHIAVSKDPKINTERVMNTPLRKMPVRKNYRLFLYIDEDAKEIQCLSLRHRSNCYKPTEIKKVLNIMRKLQE